MKFAPLLSLCFLVLLPTLSSAQLGENLSFEEACDDTKTGLCKWGVAWGKAEEIGSAKTDRGQSLHLHSGSAEAVRFVEQHVLLPATDEIQILTVSAFIKTDQVQGRGTGLSLQLYAEGHAFLSMMDMGGQYSVSWVTGTNGWKQLTLKITRPPEAVKLGLGAILYGSGDVWIDDYELTLENVNNRTPSPEAVTYLKAVVDTIMRNSLVRDSLDAETLKLMAGRVAGPEPSTENFHLAVNYLLDNLGQFGDYHSFLMTAEELSHWQGEEAEEATEPEELPMIKYPEYKKHGDYGYIAVPGFHKNDSTLKQAFADQAQLGISTLYQDGIKGWIIDLRPNDGGNMEPMIAGLGPLLDEGKLGSLLDVFGKHEYWSYQNGACHWEDEIGVPASNPVVLDTKLPIAVLYHSRTGSSGEIMILSFVGNTKTRSFGQPSMGLTTGNGTFELPDGASLFLASTTMCDRYGQPYYGSVTPDEVIEASADVEGADATLEAAIKWLENLP